jgi:methionyl-tRNA formyltransferase
MTATDNSYLVCGCRPWNRELFDRRLRGLPGTWRFCDQRSELSIDSLGCWRPRFIFFLHWNWIVPGEITEAHECVVFHMTDVPFGRGGSPLQNLMIRGYEATRLSALRMTNEVDAGPVYAKRDLQLNGTAEDIYRRAGELSADLIEWIAATEPTPVPQEGTVTTFQRRAPHESELPELTTLDELDRFIRMLDADGYPRAFLRHGSFRLELRRSTRYADRVEADVTITRLDPASGVL